MSPYLQPVAMWATFALTEQRKRPPLGILEPVEQLRRILGEAGAEATRDGVESVLVIQREENEIVAGVKHQLCHATAYLCAVLDANSELNGKEGVADPVANLGQGHPTNEAIPGGGRSSWERRRIWSGARLGRGAVRRA